jgi:signal transduction histidine kinase
MLRNRGIRSKLLAVLALPIVVLMIGAGVVSAQAFSAASRSVKIAQLAEGASNLNALIAALDAERSQALAITGRVGSPKSYLVAQHQTDAARKQVDAFISSIDLASVSPASVSAVQAATRAHAGLADVRRQVTEGFAQSDAVESTYTAMIEVDTALPTRIGDSLDDRVVGSRLAAFSDLNRLVEIGIQQQQVGTDAINSRGLSANGSTQLATLQTVQTQAISDFRDHASAALATALDTALYQPVSDRGIYTTSLRDIALSTPTAAPPTAPGTWLLASNQRVKAIAALGTPLAQDVVTSSADSASSARRTAVLILVGSLLVVGLLVGLGLYLARELTRPLRRLTITAGEVVTALPTMVERMATPGDGPGVTLPEIDVRSNDEVGQLARAFKEVNETTLRVAEEQAALRASIAEMFVNVARRNHVLLSRQLSFIDQLERTEENPETLENLFRLDHLATRMRRNAESLIVLAGIDAGRRLRRPMPLSDVIRTAVSEIERYDRVDLSLQADPPLVGHVALTSAHMIAELLENSTQFSNPDTRVITSTVFYGGGVRVTITDLGLGMTWDEITDANQRIANPPVTDVVGSQRLGFYVVGRLARRLDATVTLRPGRTQGTVVTIDLPAALFVPGTVVDVPSSRRRTDDVPAPDAGHAAQPSALEPVAAPAEVVAPAEVAPHDVEPVPAAPQPVPVAAAPALPSVVASVEALTRVQPRVPVAPAPVPHQLPVDHSGDGLPQRGPRDGQPVVPALPGPAGEQPAAPPAEARGGIFSGFRSRLSVPPAVPVAPGTEPVVPAAADSDALAAPDAFAAPVAPAEPSPRGAVLPEELSGSAGEDFVPVMAVADALPIRSLHAVPDPVVEAPALVVPDVVEDVDVPLGWDVTSEPAEVEAAVPGPLDAGWTADLEPAPVVAELAPEPAVVDDGSVALLEAEPEPEPVLAPLPSRRPVATAVQAQPSVQAEPSVHAEPAVRAEPAEPALTRPELTRPELTPEGAAPEPVQADAEPPFAPQHAPAQAQAEVAAPVGPVRGRPAADILPSRGSSRGGLFGRRKQQAAPVVTQPVVSSPVVSAPVVSAPVPDPVRAEVALPTRVAGDLPAVDAPVFGAPVVPSSGASAEPSPFAPSPVALSPFAGGVAPAETERPEPVLPPSSLFGATPGSNPDRAPAPQPAVPGLAAAQSLRERSAMASEALSELSALSSYSPQASAGRVAPTLQRRTPLATEAGKVTSPGDEEPLGARRGNRNAADVRSMLSGFQAGVARGRTSPSAGNPLPTGAPDAPSSPAHQPESHEQDA